MRLSDERIKELKILLKELYGLDYASEQAQEAGLAIIRFVIVKTQRRRELTNKKMEINND
jgi:hypothetical protein